MAKIQIETSADAKKYLKECAMVMVQIRFGTEERWFKLSKTEAGIVIGGIGSSTPQEKEMFTGVFGEYDTYEKILYLG